MSSTSYICCLMTSLEEVLKPYFMPRSIFDLNTTIYNVNHNKIQDLFTSSRKVLIAEKTWRRGVICEKCPYGVIEPKTQNFQLVIVALFFNFEVQIFICDLVTAIYFSIIFYISKIQPLTYFLRGGPFRPPPILPRFAKSPS